MQVVMVYSEAGGVSKTTTAVSIAMTAASELGKRVVLIDLDPRAASTKWLGVEPIEDGLHVGAIIAASDPEGAAREIAVQSSWHPNLRVIPSARSVSNREKESSDYAELRLASSLVGLDADLVVIDCPNRQGGPLTLSALNAADTVVYAASPNTDGWDGYEGARESVQKFIEARRRMGAPVNITEAGVIVSGIGSPIASRIEKVTVQRFDDTGMLLWPIVPMRVIAKEVRDTGEWYGNYRKGDAVAAAYRELTKKVVR